MTPDICSSIYTDSTNQALWKWRADGIHVGLHTHTHIQRPTWRSHFTEKFQFSSVAQSCPTLCNPMNHSTPGLPVHHQLSEFTQIHVHRVGDAIQPSYPLSSPPPPAPNPSQHQGLFPWVNTLHQWPKYWSFSFSISPSNEHPGLISFRMDWLDLLFIHIKIGKMTFSSSSMT